MNKFMGTYKYFNAFVFIIVMLAFVGCNKTENEVAEEVQSGVVLIANRSYYELSLSNGDTFYFSDYSEENGISGLVVDEDSIKPSISYGTGFLISKDGLIATNAHVVASQTNDKDVSREMNKIIEKVKQILSLRYDEYMKVYSEYRNLAEVARYSSSYSYEEYNQIAALRDAYLQELNDLSDNYSYLCNMNMNDLELKYINKLYIAYNNTFVTDINDFKNCVVRNIDSKHDLAIIQLADKKTPSECYVFEVPDESPFEKYSFGEKFVSAFGTDKNTTLILIGFNHGPQLALTDDGIKSQHTSGSVSQVNSSTIMYTIPAMPGSSGSPVVNLRGELVAINFAGIYATQSFNYGVYAKYLRNLIDDMYGH